MAINSTIHKVILEVVDMDRHYYNQHKITIAKHPSETDERMMVRILAFAMFAEDNLTFGKDINADNEPSLYIKDLTGEPKLWIELGQPSEKIIRKACNKSDKVKLILYGKSPELWWEKNINELNLKNNLEVILLKPEETEALASMADRSMKLTCTIENEEISIINDNETISIQPIFLKRNRNK